MLCHRVKAFFVHQVLPHGHLDHLMPACKVGNLSTCANHVLSTFPCELHVTSKCVYFSSTVFSSKRLGPGYELNVSLEPADQIIHITHHRESIEAVAGGHGDWDGKPNEKPRHPEAKGCDKAAKGHKAANGHMSCKPSKCGACKDVKSMPLSLANCLKILTVKCVTLAAQLTLGNRTELGKPQKTTTWKAQQRGLESRRLVRVRWTHTKINYHTVCRKHLHQQR